MAHVAFLVGAELGHEGREPRVERQPALAVADAEFGRAGFAGDHDRQVNEVERVANGQHSARGEAHLLEHLRVDVELADERRA